VSGTLALIVIGACVVGYGLVSNRIERTAITPPMMFTLAGLVVGPLGFALATPDIGHATIHTLAEVTLMLVLFTDAARINVRTLIRDHNMPVRLLGIGLPLTIVLGALVATVLFPAFSIWEAAVLAAMLAPTDAALGHAVVSNPRVPVRVRQALNVESGLNDGLVLPVLLICLALAGASETADGAAGWIQFVVLQVTVGPAVGVIVGLVGGRLVDRAVSTGWMNDIFRDLSLIGLALLAFGVSGSLGGNGFIAAFTAGLALGAAVRDHCQGLYEFAEAEGQLLTLLVFLVFGAVLVPDMSGSFDINVVLYGLLSLSVIRILPAWLSLLGLNLSWHTIAFVGWFGPRGLASILFGLLIVERSAIMSTDFVFAVVVFTVLVSIVAHGLTAIPGAAWYARHADTMRDEPDIPELQPTSEMPLRFRSISSNRDA
jgi:NhaP-type Na+/H+ or K+/H+ antiporter